MNECFENDFNIKPDVIIDFIDSDSYFPIAVIYVRPETNEVHYEKAIISGLIPFGDVAYLANLNGKLFIRDALILEHYTSQFKFATYAKEEILKYPEMIYAFENYFQIDFDSANIIGSFDAVLKLNITDEEMFNIMVTDKDFLKLYGQTIKKINNYYVVNYDIPAILKRYTPSANVFVIAVRMKNSNFNFIDLNQSIFEQIKQNNSPIIGEVNLKELEWNEMIKRTYHISRNHVMTMFDMLDFIIKINNIHVGFHDTPLGKYLIDNYDYEIDKLFKLKENPITYIIDGGNKKLINLVEEANYKNLDQCAELITKIIW